MKALVDADSLLYKVGFAIEEKTVWNELEVSLGLEEPLVTLETDLDQCYSSFDLYIENILCAVELEEVVLVYTGSNNFRDNNPLGYKENRKNLNKPLGYDALLQYSKDKYNSIVIDDMEADDYVVYEKTTKPDDYILCAIDKDVLYQTEGTHYNYHTDEFVETTKEEATHYAYLQTLMGDPSDGYTGIPRVGKVKATKILDGLTTEQEMWKAVVDAYEAKGLSVEDAINTMRLANMHQYNGTEICLWNPPL
jgi:DNA polymerase-1